MVLAGCFFAVNVLYSRFKQNDIISKRYIMSLEINAFNPRKKVLLDLAQNRPPVIDGSQGITTEFFGENVFDQKTMRERLPKDTFQKLIATIQKGEKLDMNIANTVQDKTLHRKILCLLKIRQNFVILGNRILMTIVIGIHTGKL